MTMVYRTAICQHRRRVEPHSVLVSDGRKGSVTVEADLGDTSLPTVVAYGFSVDGRGGPMQGKDGIDETLTAFLAFRESDMEQWRRAGAATGLTHSAMLVLSTILRADLRGDPLRQVDLRKRLHLSPAGVSTMVDELETRHLVERRRSETDRRAHLLHAGAEAGAFLDKLDRVDSDFRAYVAKFTADQRAAVISLLGFMRDVGDAEYR